jgi:hypothetical protein
MNRKREATTSSSPAKRQRVEHVPAFYRLPNEVLDLLIDSIHDEPMNMFVWKAMLKRLRRVHRVFANSELLKGHLFQRITLVASPEQIEALPDAPFETLQPYMYVEM